MTRTKLLQTQNIILNNILKMQILGQLLTYTLKATQYYN